MYHNSKAGGLRGGRGAKRAKNGGLGLHNQCASRNADSQTLVDSRAHNGRAGVREGSSAKLAEECINEDAAGHAGR